MMSFQKLRAPFHDSYDEDCSILMSTLGPQFMEPLHEFYTARIHQQDCVTRLRTEASGLKVRVSFMHDKIPDRNV